MHRTLTWTTGSLSLTCEWDLVFFVCVCVVFFLYFYILFLCVYTRGTSVYCLVIRRRRSKRTLAVANKPYGFCGRKAPWKKKNLWRVIVNVWLWRLIVDVWLWRLIVTSDCRRLIVTPGCRCLIVTSDVWLTSCCGSAIVTSDHLTVTSDCSSLIVTCYCRRLTVTSDCRRLAVNVLS